MLRRLYTLIMSGTVLLTLGSCRMVSEFLHDEQVVASVGSHKLYRSELAAVIPSGLPQEDSLRLAVQYIDNWASGKVFLEMAQKQLSKEELDVSKELEDYRTSLLKYRYEQHYVSERLDTMVTSAQILEYFESHKESFRLRVPIVKARFMRVTPDSPECERMRKMLSSQDEAELLLLDSLAYSNADRYTNFGDLWIEATRLASEFSTDYLSVLSARKNSYVEIENPYGKLDIAYLHAFVKAGEIPPVEYCEGRIKDIIVGARKQELTRRLEQDLLDKARASGNFTIY